jgi:glycosyltransferase involved in cell wall biosynthesis
MAPAAPRHAVPRVSIGLPVHNGENFLAAALDSILAQTFEDFELIISDNASTDRTEDICREYAARDSRLLYHRNASNLGASTNFNHVFERSLGQYFKWAAHDDLIAPTFLERCVEILDREPEVVLCFPAIGYINEQGRIERIAQGNLSICARSPADRLCCFVNYQIAGEDIFWAVFGLMRSEALRQTGLLGKYIAADQILLMKLLLLWQFYEIPELLYYRRIHPLASTVKLPQLRTYRERMQWYDANSTARIVLPNWRLAIETLTAIRDGQMVKRAKARCYYPIARMFTRRWKRLARELISIPSQLLNYAFAE